MITCVVEYTIGLPGSNPSNSSAARGSTSSTGTAGQHHGYFLPSEGASDRALALFSFPSLAAYENYRALFGVDPDFVAADRIRDQSGCVLKYERSFMRPVLGPDAES